MLGTLLANPVNRHPTVTASSIATIDELAPGRTSARLGRRATPRCGWPGCGRRASRSWRRHAAHARAARRRGGRGRRRAAGAPAASPAGADLDRRRRAAHAAHGRRRRRRRLHPRGHSPGEHRAARSTPSARAPPRRARSRRRSGLGAIFHTVLVDDRGARCSMGKSMAAGYYEYSPMLFEPPRLRLDRAAIPRRSSTSAGLARLPPRARSRSQRPRRRLPARRPPPTRSACAAAPARSSGSCSTCCARVAGRASTTSCCTRSPTRSSPSIRRTTLHRAASPAGILPAVRSGARPLAPVRVGRRRPLGRGRPGRRRPGPGRGIHGRPSWPSVARGAAGWPLQRLTRARPPGPLQAAGTGVRASRTPGEPATGRPATAIFQRYVGRSAPSGYAGERGYARPVGEGSADRRGVDRARSRRVWQACPRRRLTRRSSCRLRGSRSADHSPPGSPEAPRLRVVTSWLRSPDGILYSSKWRAMPRASPAVMRLSSVRSNVSSR